MKILLFVDNDAYLLLDKVRFAGNKLKGGQVVNGDWNLEIRNGTSVAIIGETVLNSWEYTAPYYYVVVPEDIPGDYYDVVRWAVNQDRSHRCPA